MEVIELSAAHRKPKHKPLIVFEEYRIRIGLVAARKLGLSGEEKQFDVEFAKNADTLLCRVCDFHGNSLSFKKQGLGYVSRNKQASEMVLGTIGIDKFNTKCIVAGETDNGYFAVIPV